ncbi:RNA polymerase sigma factor [Streptomyces sp.]|uniref:RNA polymerase sigma factor n=1 Tax=Streptomyces sp. TaxID=1931 RepID=UPI0025EFB0A6|nr:RNA polymerase sigma factor [Streptomyces sp.]
MRTRVRNGDPDAFAALFDECARAVYNHAFRLTADWSLAEDVMSTTFMEAWRRRASVEAAGGSLRPWLLGIATNVARSHHRSNRRYRKAASAAAAANAAGEQIDDHAEETAGRVDDRRRLNATLAALSLLKRPEREVLTLCLYEGMGYAEAARALGIPVGTVRSRLSRARTRLRKLADAQLLEEKREPTRTNRQITGDRGYAVRSVQEGNR